MPPERRALVAAVAAGVVMTLALGLVLAFGQLHYPEFAPLADQPDPRIPGTVEFVRWDRSQTCRFEVPARGGEVAELSCGPDAPSRDPGAPDRDRTREDGATLQVGGFDGTARVALRHPEGREEVLLEVDGPRDYAFWDALWSPDGEWVLVVDSAQRLLIVPAAGGPARLLVTDASDPIWRR